MAVLLFVSIYILNIYQRTRQQTLIHSGIYSVIFIIIES